MYYYVILIFFSNFVIDSELFRLNIVNRARWFGNSLELYNISHYLCFCSDLCRNEVLHRHVRIVFLPN